MAQDTLRTMLKQPDGMPIVFKTLESFHKVCLKLGVGNHFELFKACRYLSVSK
jgi:hypothetical protein